MRRCVAITDACLPSRSVSLYSFCVPSLRAGRELPALLSLRAMRVVVEAVVSTAWDQRLSRRAPLREGARSGVRAPAFALWRYAIGQRIRVKIGVIAQTRPGTVLFGCIRHAGFLTFCKVVPRIVPSDG